jgi:hypothetical protein
MARILAFGIRDCAHPDSTDQRRQMAIASV